MVGGGWFSESTSRTVDRSPGWCDERMPAQSGRDVRLSARGRNRGRAAARGECVILRFSRSKRRPPVSLSVGAAALLCASLLVGSPQGQSEAAPNEDAYSGPSTLAVRRGRTYFIKNSLGPGRADRVVNYGRPHDAVLVGDWNGDGVDSLAVRRGSTYYFANALRGGRADKVIAYGRPSDRVLAGDWNGDGKDTLAVRRGRTYYVVNSLRGGRADRVVPYGKPSDAVLVGDWNDDGVDTLAVRRGRTYYVANRLRGGKADKVIAYGHSSDRVLVGDWDGDGQDTFGVRRGSRYYLRNTLSGGEADVTFPYGRPRDAVLAGSWTGVTPKAVRLAGSARRNGATLTGLGTAWAANSVNSVAFRKDSVTSGRDATTGRWMQYAAYYDGRRHIVLATRSRVSQNAAWTEWHARRTAYSGNTRDAHDAISLAVDGDGYLHMAWGLHDGGLGSHYVRSTRPWPTDAASLQRRRVTASGDREDRVTYPQFFRIPDMASEHGGGLFLLYREGESGNGNAVLDRYDLGPGGHSGTWTRVSNHLLDGRVTRANGSSHNAYWQGVVDSAGRLHLSWTWRENPNVASNHDIGYARSTSSSGEVWQSARGDACALQHPGGSGEQPQITAADRCAYAAFVPQGSALMNQTSMTVLGTTPYIASYWSSRRQGAVVQYHVLAFQGGSAPDSCAKVSSNADARSSERTSCPGWSDVGPRLRSTAFDLSGTGTQAVPMARPQIVGVSRGASGAAGRSGTLGMLIRDSDVASGAAALVTAQAGADGSVGAWVTHRLTADPLGEWEPTYDAALLRATGRLDVFVERVGQADDERLTLLAPQPAYVLDLPGLPDV